MVRELNKTMGKLWVGGAAALAAATVASSSLGAEAACPPAFSNEPTRIFHAGPKRRLVSRPRLSRGGRVCVNFQAPTTGGKRRCPVGWRFDKYDVLHTGPARRLIRGKWQQWGSWPSRKKKTCIAVARPGSPVYNPKLRNSPGREMRRLKFVELTGHVMGTFPVRSPRACERVCMQGDLCKGFTVDRRSCKLLSHISGVRPGRHFSSGVRTQPGSPVKVVRRNVSDGRGGIRRITERKTLLPMPVSPLFAQQRVVLSRRSLMRFGAVPSEADCAGICAAEGRCRAYIYTGGALKACFLYSSARQRAAGRKRSAKVRYWPVQVSADRQAQQPQRGIDRRRLRRRAPARQR